MYLGKFYGFSDLIFDPPIVVQTILLGSLWVLGARIL